MNKNEIRARTTTAAPLPAPTPAIAPVLRPGFPAIGVDAEVQVSATFRDVVCRIWLRDNVEMEVGLSDEGAAEETELEVMSVRSSVTEL